MPWARSRRLPVDLILKVKHAENNMSCCRCPRSRNPHTLSLHPDRVSPILSRPGVPHARLRGWRCGSREAAAAIGLSCLCCLSLSWSLIVQASLLSFLLADLCSTFGRRACRLQHSTAALQQQGPPPGAPIASHPTPRFPTLAVESGAPVQNAQLEPCPAPTGPSQGRRPQGARLPAQTSSSLLWPCIVRRRAQRGVQSNSLARRTLVEALFPLLFSIPSLERVVARSAFASGPRRPHQFQFCRYTLFLLFTFCRASIKEACFRTLLLRLLPLRPPAS